MIQQQMLMVTEDIMFMIQCIDTTGYAFSKLRSLPLSQLDQILKILHLFFFWYYFFFQYYKNLN